MRLTPGAEAAWMIAAGEAAAGGHPRIEPAHLLIGVLSLGKLGPGAEAAGLGVERRPRAATRAPVSSGRSPRRTSTRPG